MESYASWSQSRPSSSPELCFQSRLAQNLEAARNLVKDMCHIVHLQCCVSGLLQISSTHDDMITHFVTRAQQASMEKGLSTTCFTQPALLTAVAAGAQVKRTEVQSHQACQTLCNAGHPAVTVLQYSRTQCDIVSKHPSTVFINRGCNVDDQDMRQQHTSCRDDAVPTVIWSRPREFVVHMPRSLAVNAPRWMLRFLRMLRPILRGMPFIPIHAGAVAQQLL